MEAFFVQGSRFKVQGSRFKVQGSRFKVQGSRFKVQGSRFKVQIILSENVIFGAWSLVAFRITSEVGANKKSRSIAGIFL